MSADHLERRSNHRASLTRTHSGIGDRLTLVNADVGELLGGPSIPDGRTWQLCRRPSNARSGVPMLTIRLMGIPAILRGAHPLRSPRGRKAWALLTFVLLSERPRSRRRLAEMLFSDADDPLGALRWTLAELRRALAQPAALRGDPVTVRLDGDVDVDLHLLTRGHTDTGRPLDTGLLDTGLLDTGLLDIGGELLETGRVRQHPAQCLEQRFGLQRGPQLGGVHRPHPPQ